MSNEESERITTSQDVISRLHDKIDEQHARIVELEAQLDAATHPTQQGMDDLHKQMLKALESVGAHTVTDCDGDEITAYFCNWQAISDAKRAAQAKQGGF